MRSLWTALKMGAMNYLHSIPPNILDLEERRNLKMSILASQDLSRKLRARALLIAESTRTL